MFINIDRLKVRPESILLIINKYAVRSQYSLWPIYSIHYNLVGFFALSCNSTPLGFCLRVIVNKKTTNVEKTTSSIISVTVN